MEPGGRAVPSGDGQDGLLQLGRHHHLGPGRHHCPPPLLPSLAPGIPQAAGTASQAETKFDESGSLHQKYQQQRDLTIPCFSEDPNICAQHPQLTFNLL